MKPFTPKDREIYAQMQTETSADLLSWQRLYSIFNMVGMTAVGAGAVLVAEVSDAGWLAIAGGAYASYRSSLAASFVTEIMIERYAEPTQIEQPVL